MRQCTWGLRCMYVKCCVWCDGALATQISSLAHFTSVRARKAASRLQASPGTLNTSRNRRPVGPCSSKYHDTAIGTTADTTQRDWPHSFPCSHTKDKLSNKLESWPMAIIPNGTQVPAGDRRRDSSFSVISVFRAAGGVWFHSDFLVEEIGRTIDCVHYYWRCNSYLSLFLQKFLYVCTLKSCRSWSSWGYWMV